jgi:hypothetical protein
MSEIDGSGQSVPLTDQERAARHFGVDLSQVTADMIEKLPARGSRAVALEASESKEAEKEDGAESELVGMFFIVHSMAHMETASSPGIVVNEALAKSSPCRCATLDGSELCFSRGIVGALDKGEKKLYCPTKTYFESAGLTERLKKFKEAVAAAQEKVKHIPKGERLEPWLAAMSEELEKRGIEV